MSKKLYKGFSSENWYKNRSFNIYDVELVKQDLMNHIYTIKGERLMMPWFGTRIPLMLHEPCDEKTKMIIEEDIMDVIKFDKRLELVSLKSFMDADLHVIAVSVVVKYLELNFTENINLEIKTK